MAATILFEHGEYSIRSADKGWFEVYKNMGVASRRVGRYGPGYYDRAKADVIADRWKPVNEFRNGFGIKGSSA